MSTSILNRGLAALTPLLVVPIGLSYLGASAYGAWAAAISLTAFAAFADLGIGTGLMTKLGGLDVSVDPVVARRHISSAYVMMTAITTSAIVTLWASASVIDWGSMLGARPGTEASTAEPIVLVTFSAFIVNMLASLIVRVQYGIGQQGRSNVWQSVGSVSALGMTWFAARLNPGVPWFVALSAFTPVLVAWLNTTSFFVGTAFGRTLRPRRHDFDLGVTRRLLSLGSRFLVISVLMTASIALDPWIVARTSALDEVPQYTIPYRILALLGTLMVMLTLPLWPLHASAIRAGDVAWIKRITLRMSVATTAVVLVLGCLAGFVGPGLVDRWLGGDVPTESFLWFGLTLWWVVQGVTGPAFMVQNGAEILWPQTLGYLLLVAVVPLKWWVSSEFGFVWIPIVGSVVYVVVIWPACAFGFRKAIERAAAAHRVRQNTP